jgi:hypothetical protein
MTNISILNFFNDRNLAVCGYFLERERERWAGVYSIYITREFNQKKLFHKRYLFIHKTLFESRKRKGTTKLFAKPFVIPSGRQKSLPNCSATFPGVRNPCRSLRQPFRVSEILAEVFGKLFGCQKSLPKSSASFSGARTACRTLRLPVRDSGRLQKRIIFKYINIIN